MDSGRGWNPTSSGDNTTEYYWYKWPGMFVTVLYRDDSRNKSVNHYPPLCWFEFDHNCLCHPGPQKGPKKPMDNGYECISVDFGSGQSKVQGFPRKRPGPGRYMALYSRSHIIIDFCPRMTLTPPHGCLIHGPVPHENQLDLRKIPMDRPISSGWLHGWWMDVSRVDFPTSSTPYIAVFSRRCDENQISWNLHSWVVRRLHPLQDTDIFHSRVMCGSAERWQYGAETPSDKYPWYHE